MAKSGEDCHAVTERQRTSKPLRSTLPPRIKGKLSVTDVSRHGFKVDYNRSAENGEEDGAWSHISVVVGFEIRINRTAGCCWSTDRPAALFVFAIYLRRA